MKPNLVILDDRTWVKQFVIASLGKDFFILPSSTSFRQMWDKIKGSHAYIVHWESQHKKGGTIAEELIETSKDPFFSEKLIVITTNPTYEDVVYLSEIQVRKVLRLSAKTQDWLESKKKLTNFLIEIKHGEYDLWLSLLKKIIKITHEKKVFNVFELETLDEEFQKLSLEQEEMSARVLDIAGSLAFLKNSFDAAESLWRAAVDSNGNYLRSYHNLIDLYKKQGRFEEAYAILQKLQGMNRSLIARQLEMGEIQIALKNDEKSLSFFEEVLRKDPLCARALNGLAEIHFNRGNLEKSKELLSQSNLAVHLASRLNQRGIELVKSKNFEEAFELYQKAHYVLPEQEKSPMLFYNMGLCLSRWGKLELANDFLKFALIKSPGYQKAQTLINMNINKKNF